MFPYSSDNMQTAAEREALVRHRKRLEDDNYCKPNVSYVWCLPRDYNQEKHPVTCEYQGTHIMFDTHFRQITL